MVEDYQLKNFYHQNVDISFGDDPKPANKGIWVQMIATQNESAVISILDITGKQIFTTNERVTTGENKFYVNTKNINSGFYIVEVRTATNTSRLNLIID